MHFFKQLLLTAAILQACVLFACDDGMSNFVDAQIQKHQINCCSSYEVQEAVVLYNRGVFGFFIDFDRTGSKQLLIEALESNALPLPHYTAANYYLGRLYLKEKNHERAIWLFKNVLNYPDLPIEAKAKANGFLGSSYFMLRHYVDAIEPLSKALEGSNLHPIDQNKVTVLLGVSHFNLGNNTSALPFLENAKNNALSDKDKDHINKFLVVARKNVQSF